MTDTKRQTNKEIKIGRKREEWRVKWGSWERKRKGIKNEGEGRKRLGIYRKGITEGRQRKKENVVRKIDHQTAKNVLVNARFTPPLCQNTQSCKHYSLPIHLNLIHLYILKTHFTGNFFYNLINIQYIYL